MSEPRASTERVGMGRSLVERLAAISFFACGAWSIVVTVGIAFVLLEEGLGFFREVSIWEFLTSREWAPLFAEKHFGILPLLSGTAMTTAFAIATALPLGILAAIFLSEFATPRVRQVLKPLIEVLAGVPTVVYGYFALTFLTPLLQRFIPDLAGFNAIGPGLVMGIMIFPVITSLSEDAIFAVPTSLREAALALGATKLATIFRVVLPSAFSGISSAVILGISRAIGETMIVAIAAGQQPRMATDPRVPVETMTAYIVQVSLGDTPSGTLEYRTIFAVGLALFALTLGLNLMAATLRRRLQRAWS